MSIPDLLHGVNLAADELPDFMDKVHDEIHDATIADDSARLNRLTTVLTRLTLLAMKYNRRQITAIDDSQEVIDATKHLENATNYMKDVIAGNIKVANTFTQAAGALGFLKEVSDQFVA